MNTKRVAIVCACNMNRSMEAHDDLQKQGFNVRSFGVAPTVKLPGQARHEIISYDFGVTYEHILNDLMSRNADYYTRTGIKTILQRNMTIKSQPEKFQDCEELFDFIITCDKYVFRKVIMHFADRAPTGANHPVYVINIDIADNIAIAAAGAIWIRKLLTAMINCENLDRDAFPIIKQFGNKIQRDIQKMKVYYF